MLEGSAETQFMWVLYTSLDNRVKWRLYGRDCRPERLRVAFLRRPILVIDEDESNKTATAPH